MKLFIINEVLQDYTSGMVCIKAENLDDCRDRFIEWLDLPKSTTEEYLEEFDTAIKYGKFLVLELSYLDPTEPGVVGQCWGGG